MLRFIVMLRGTKKWEENHFTSVWRQFPFISERNDHFHIIFHRPLQFSSSLTDYS